MSATSNWLDLSSSSNLYIRTYMNGFLDISGGNVILRNNNLFLKNADASLNGRLFVSADTSLNGNIAVGGNLTVNGNLSVKAYTQQNVLNTITTNTFSVIEDLSLNGRILVSGDASLNGRLFVSGNVGIGTSSINGKLHIYEGTGTGDAGTTSGSLVIEHGNNGGVSSIIFPSKNNYNSDYGYIRYRDDVNNGTGGAEQGRLEIGTNDDIGAAGGVVDALILQKGGGYVGIGVVNPGCALNVNGSFQTYGVPTGFNGIGYTVPGITTIYNGSGAGYTNSYCWTPGGGAINGVWDWLSSTTAAGNAPTFLNVARIGSTGSLYFKGSTNPSGFDYAEMYEWEDLNPNNETRYGYPVVFTTKRRVRIATHDDDPNLIIGIVSVNPATLNGTAWDGWNERYMKDEWGIELKDSIGNYVLNPAYDPSLNYVSRLERPEWAKIGLLGILRLFKGQPVGPRWIKTDNISDTVEEWFVR